jgi:hypothetical protein
MEQNTNKESEHCFYHYTTQDTLCGMLNNYRENMNPGNLIFWASSIFTMNDPQEMQHGVDVFKVLVPANEALSEIPFEERLNIESFDSKKILSKHSNTPFVISLSRNKDDLAMWSLYGDGGRGVVLKFNKDLQSYPSDLTGVTKPENVYYGDGTDKMQLLYRIYNDGLEELRQCTNEDQRRACREKTLSKLYVHICPFIKTEAYKMENESRLSYYNIPYRLIKFRTRNKNVIPYIEVPIPVKYLEEIIIGPCCNYELALRSIRYLLDSCGLQRVDISKSSIPYRNI